MMEQYQLPVSVLEALDYQQPVLWLVTLANQPHFPLFCSLWGIAVERGLTPSVGFVAGPWNNSCDRD